MKFKKYLEDVFSAVAFAEKGLDISEFGLTRRRSAVESLAERLEDAYAAVAFAESNYHDMALEIMKKKAAKGALIKFLEDVGLSNVPVKLCIVNL